MPDSLISTENLTKNYQIGYGEVHALQGVSVAVEPGEFISVTGPSGSGKSTFMNLIGCLDTPDSGEIWLDGEPVSSYSKNDLAEIRNQHIGFVFQQFNLLGRTSALDNVALPLLYAGVDKPARMSRAREALEQVNLADRTDHNPFELSGGQQQRVAIARAIVNEPRLLLADEPTGALDSHTGHEIMELFNDLNKSGITVIVVTHEAEVASYAQRSLRFLDGRIVNGKGSDEEKA